MYTPLFANKIKPGLILLLSIWLTACSSHRYLYYVPTPNNPTFEKKGDSKISAEYSGTIQGNVESNGGAFQGAYALTDHWAVGYNFDYREEKSTYHNIQFTSNDNNQIINNYYDSSLVFTQRSAHEFSVGYYKSLNKSNSLFFSTYGGYGIGLIHMKESGTDSALNSYQRDLQAAIHKIFIQPSFYYRPTKNTTLALIAKVSGFYYQFSNNNYTQGEKVYYKMNINNKDPFIDLEPTFLFSFGWENVQIIASYTFSAKLSGKPIDAIATSFSIGGSIDIANIIRQR